MSKNKTESKDQLRIQEDRVRRRNIWANSIKEDENETWEGSEDKLRFFLYDELEMNDELYVERADRASRRGGVKIIAITLIEQFLLSY